MQSVTMRILHIIPSISSLRGGPSQAVLEMVKVLQKCGVNAEILTTNDDGYSLLDVPHQHNKLLHI